MGFATAQHFTLLGHTIPSSDALDETQNKTSEKAKGKSKK
jgi:hypothetical protein